MPVTKNAEINDISSELCTQKKVQKQLRIIQIDITASPFIMGFHFPIIVLPNILSKEEAKFVLMHELEHLIHNHILIKSIIDLIAVIYWWNPIIWLLRTSLRFRIASGYKGNPKSVRKGELRLIRNFS